MHMNWIRSVAPVVLVITSVVPLPGTACTGLARVVISFATHHQDVALVKAGEMPVMVDVLPESNALPVMK